MSWSLISFALPAFGLLKVFGLSNPASYKRFDDMPESNQAASVNAIVERVLNAENVQGAEHFERIEDMLKELPDSVGSKTIQSLVHCRLKVVKVETDDFPVFATGTDAQAGKYYIGVKPDFEMGTSLPWVITHELSHILNDDPLTLQIVKTVGSLGAAALSTFVLGWSLLPSLGATILTNCVTHIIYSQWSERAADGFAIKHCSREQLEEGIAFFELMKARRVRSVYKNNLITWALHPSENSRIAKIRDALGLTEKAKPA